MARNAGRREAPRPAFLACPPLVAIIEEALLDDQADDRERGCFHKLSDPVYGELTLQMPVWRMTETPPRIRWACRPTGYHTAYVYQKYLGLGPRRLAELRDGGVI